MELNTFEQRLDINEDNQEQAYEEIEEELQQTVGAGYSQMLQSESSVVRESDYSQAATSPPAPSDILDTKREDKFNAII